MEFTAEEEMMLAEAMLGQETEEWLQTDLARYMLGRAEQEEREAMDALAKCGAWRRRRIAELQTRIWRARSFRAWLGELVVTGRQALQSLDDARREARDE